MSSDPFAEPRAKGGRAPDVFRPGAWVPMQRISRDATKSTSRSLAQAPAAVHWQRCWPSKASRSSPSMPGAYFRPLEDFASDETEQNQLYWNDARVVDGPNPIQMGGKNSGKAVGGSTVHYAMVSLRFRPEWFKSRTTLGYGADWPI